MSGQETLLERLIPGDLEHQIPAAVRKALPGGWRNRLLQAALGLLITFGFAFVVRRMVERREAKRRALAPVPAAQALPPAPPEPEPAAPPPTEPVIEAPPSEAGPSRHALLARPHVLLSGEVDQAMYASFRAQLAAAPPQGPLVVALSTPGGDPEVARLIGEEIRLLRDYAGRETLFLGRVAVQGAGAALMAAFPAEARFLTRGTRIRLEEQGVARTIALPGSLRAAAAALRARLGEIEQAARIEEDGLRALVAGSRLSLDTLRERAAAGWSIEAGEARDLGLVCDVI